MLFLSLAIGSQQRLHSLQEENRRLTERISCLEPAEPYTIKTKKKISFPYTGRQVLDSGVSVEYRTLELNNQWERPIYNSVWHSTCWNSPRFSYIPRLVEYNRHRVFIYEGGGSSWFDLSPAMGFNDQDSPLGIAFKTRYETAIIALEAKIIAVKRIENQITIVIKPVRKGYHIIAVTGKNLDEMVYQVVTPEGYELESAAQP